MKDKKKWVIGILCTLVCIMAVGYAVLAQQLNITGTTSIDSTWKVEITNIQEKEVVGKAVSKVTPSYTSTTANFSVGLTQPGDSITYDIEISNLGTLKAKVDSININLDENDAIKYTTTGVASGDKLGVGEKATLTIKVEYDSNVTSQPAVTSKDITITINYVQDLEEGNASTTYQVYSIGDTITFAGSNWYVIKNSTEEEDYVTLLKEQILSIDELGDYATGYCTDIDVQYNRYGCTITNKKKNAMAYFYTDACLPDSIHSTSFVDEECINTDYNTSKVKEMLENQYLPTLGSDNLKEIAGYKIRLLNWEDLSNNLGYYSETVCTYYCREDRLVGSDTPEWIASSGSEEYYWTMEPTGGYNDRIDAIGYYKGLDGNHNIVTSIGVRPVINLLKSSIQ